MPAVQLEMPFAVPAAPPREAKRKVEGKETAEAIVRRTLTECLPPDVPTSFKKITAARFKGRNSIVATLEMYDGLPGIVHLERWLYGWSHRWEWTPGEYLMWDGKQWQRREKRKG